MKTKAKGSRAERRAMVLLEAEGYVCTKAGGSLGLFDVGAVGATHVRLIQVKAGTKYLSRDERARMTALRRPTNVRCEVWRFPDRCLSPLTEVIADGRAGR